MKLRRPPPTKGLVAVVWRDLLADLLEFSMDCQTLDTPLSDGRYHGFGDARKCPNDGCPEAAVVRAWDSVMEAASALRKFHSANVNVEARD